MKLKMAPNSLFAMLLRSPWWISFALVLVIALATRALLPEAIAPYGVMGALPFLVIGSIAAVRQWRAPSASQTERIQGMLGQIAWRDFALAMEQAYGRQGYQVSRIASGPADLLLTKDGRTTLVTCKRWKAANHGAESLRSLAADRLQRDASHCIYVSILPVNDACQRSARENNVNLLSGTDLVALVRHEKAFA